MIDESAISLRHIGRAVRLHWLLAFAVSVSVFSLAAHRIMSLRPEYTSTAMLLLAPAGEELGRPLAERMAATTDPFFVRTETDIIASNKIRGAVVDELGLVGNPLFQPTTGLLKRLLGGRETGTDAVLSLEEKLRDHVLSEYGDRLAVFNDGRSKTVRISFSAPDPRLAADVANAHADAYLREQSERRGRAQQDSIDWLEREVRLRGDEFRRAEADIQQYRAEHRIVAPGDATATMTDQRVSELSSQLIQAQTEVANRNATLTEIRRARKGGEVQAVSALSREEGFANLIRRRDEAEADISALATRLAPGHPELVKRRQELGSINVVLEGELQRVEDAARSTMGAALTRAANLEKVLAEENVLKASQDRAAAGLPELAVQANIRRAVFESVLGRYQTLLTERAFSAPQASLVSSAFPSATPSFPNTALFLVIAAMIATFCGLGAAAVVHAFRRPSLGLAAAANAVGARPLVAIPRLRRSAPLRRGLTIGDSQLFTEAIRSVRNTVLAAPRMSGPAVCLVTSAMPCRGKSMISLTLARAVALTGARTLYMDFDLRRPSGSMLVGCAPPVEGLVAILEGRVSIDQGLSDLVLLDAQSDLHMLLSEEGGSIALDRLTASAMTRLIEKVARHYDAVIIDSPPVGVVADALAFAAVANQVVVVAKDRETSLVALADTVRLLREEGAGSIGLILTAVDRADMAAADRAAVRQYLGENTSGALVSLGRVRVGR